MYKFLVYLSIIILLASCSKHVAVKKQYAPVNDEVLIDYNYFLNEALKNKHFGNVQKSLQYYHKCLELNPGADVPAYELSLIYAYYGEQSKMLNYARDAYLKKGNNKWYATNLAKIYLAQNKLDSAILIYEDLTSRVHSISYLKNLAYLYEKNKDYNKSLKLINELEKETGIVEELSLFKNSIYSTKGDTKKAVIEIERLLVLHPNSVNYLTIIAENYANGGKHYLAEQYYKKVLDIDSTYGIAQISYGSFLLKTKRKEEAQIKLVNAFENSSLELNLKINFITSYLFNQFEFYTQHLFLFSELYETLLKNYPDNVQILTLVSDHYISLKKYDLALSFLRKAKSLDTKNAYLWEQYLAVENYFNNSDSIFANSQKAIDIFPYYPKFYFYRGVSAWQLEKFDEAINALETGLNFIKKDTNQVVQFYSILGEVYYRQNRYKKSDYYFDRVLEIQPNNVMVLNNYSYYLSIRNEKLENALKYSKRTLVQHPNNPTYLDTYAWILFKLKRYSEALIYIEKAIKYDSEIGFEVLEHYGDILFHNNKIEKAIKFWKLSKEKGNNSKSLDEKISNSKF